METLKKQHLFWDVNLEKLDARANQEFIVARILQQGDEEDFRWAEEFYGKEVLQKIFVKNVQKLNKKSCNFWSLYFKSDPSSCTAKQLMQKQSAFWTK